LNRRRTIFSISVFILAVTTVSCVYFGYRYEMSEFSPAAKQVLDQTGESTIIGLKWIAVGLVPFVLSIIRGSFALASWINWKQTRRMT